MKINIQVADAPVKEGCFAFGNIGGDYGVNSEYVTKNKEPYVPVSGEFHFSRYDRNEWKRELLKMKAGGLNCVSTYVFWNHHEYRKMVYDFSGNKDIAEFLRICKEVDMPCILRIGPWAHGECRWGGFPPYVQSMARKRSDSPAYLAAVERFWRELYKQVAPYCDGKTVMAIQLENEYTGSINHLYTLRTLAEKIGFKTQFFTMTAWPTNTPNPLLLGTFGGYPDAGWARSKKPLKPAGRFAICKGRSEVEIGEDLIKGRRNKVSFDDYIYAGCEVGVGIQTTQHRRPYISSDAGYGVAFAKFASGMNWIGYYMYHGGRNPDGRLYQESVLTGYPNNYPIKDYDFQAPLSKDGACRPHYHRLRLMHYFIRYWDKDIAAKSANFIKDYTISQDEYLPYCSVRANEDLDGYLFLSNYEKGRDSVDIKGIDLKISSGRKSVKLPRFDLKNGDMYFIPISFSVGEHNVDYVWAQPVLKDNNTWYFMRIAEKTQICVDGKVQEIDSEFKLGKVKFVILEPEKALSMYYIDGKIYFYDGIMYQEDGEIIRENVKRLSAHNIQLNKAKARPLPYNHFLYSYGRRRYYEITLDTDLIEAHDDVILHLSFNGLNMQIFSGAQLIDDMFAYDSKYDLHLRQLKKYIGKNGKLVLKAVPATRFGTGKVFFEKGVTPGKADIVLEGVSVVDFEKCSQ